MAITEAERMQVIQEYKEQEALKQLERRCKVKPLHDASVYYNKRFKESYLGSSESWGIRIFHSELMRSIWEAVRSSVCFEFGLKRITDLKAEDYERANDYAIVLIDDLFNRICP